MNLLTLENIFLDLVDPFTVLSVPLFEAAVIIIEALIIYFLLEKKGVKAFVSSLSANLITGLLILFYPFFLETSSMPTTLVFIILLPLLINILVESGVLKLFYKSIDTMKILKVSALMNLASYAILMINFMYLFGI